MPKKMPEKCGGTDTANPFRMLRVSSPTDHNNILSYNVHPDGHENPAELKSNITEYQLK
ncbi:Hypothetical protein CINCED_3A014412 [Cinara cedri]|uniref:Uncharacterized protein n=1 Tax=Cinara cedri TaxID=506608 RepID=A0A5E4MWK2_9HEMI|nr:Hypothetical protein CINCED_3A014412 [Cinara cedri]